MKKSNYVLILPLVILMLFWGFPAKAMEIDSRVHYIIDGKYDPKVKLAMLSGDEVLLPADQFVELMGSRSSGIKMQWVIPQESIYIVTKSKLMYVERNKKEIEINGKKIKLSTAPIRYQKALYLPLKAIMQQLNRKLVYDSYTGTVVIGDKSVMEQTEGIIKKVDQVMTQANTFTTEMTNEMEADGKRSTMKRSMVTDCTRRYQFMREENGEFIFENDTIGNDSFFRQKFASEAFSKPSKSSTIHLDGFFRFKGLFWNAYGEGVIPTIDKKQKKITLEGDVIVLSAPYEPELRNLAVEHQRFVIDLNSSILQSVTTYTVEQDKGMNFAYTQKTSIIYSAVNQSVQTPIPEEIAQMLSASKSALSLSAAGSGSDKPVELGNSKTNIAYSGLVAQDKDWIYYNHFSSFYRMKLDGSGSTKINSDNAQCINLIGDSIYYLRDTGVESDDIDAKVTEVIKMDKDGSHRKVIGSGLYGEMLAADGYLYFIDYNGNEKGFLLKRMDLDGGKEKVLAQDCDTLGAFDISDKYIYYCAYQDVLSGSGGGVYRINLDGSGRLQLDATQGSGILQRGDQLYCYYEDEDELYRSIAAMKTDGSENSIFMDGPLDYFTVIGDRIYYVDKEHSLFSVNRDGTQNVKLASKVSGIINIVGDWIYIYSNTSEKDGAIDNGMDLSESSQNQLVRIKVDGTKTEKLISHKIR